MWLNRDPLAPDFRIAGRRHLPVPLARSNRGPTVILPSEHLHPAVCPGVGLNPSLTVTVQLSPPHALPRFSLALQLHDTARRAPGPSFHQKQWHTPSVPAITGYLEDLTLTLHTNQFPQREVTDMWQAAAETLMNTPTKDYIAEEELQHIHEHILVYIADLYRNSKRKRKAIDNRH